MTIADILKQKSGEIFSIGSTAKLCDAIKELNTKKVGALLVKNEDGTLAGILTERDILTKACPKNIQSEDALVSEMMTPREKLIIGTDKDTVSYVMHVMTDKKIRHLPIYDGEKLVGLISIGDVIKTVMDQSEAEVHMLKEHIKNPYGINFS
ncbi:MAG: CBS domain-containing protein [Spirochaetales bacterium]|nr:CBS domain-containing protein [Spirochaetales bacterium]